MYAICRARKRAFSLCLMMILAVSFTLIIGTAAFGMKAFAIKSYVTDQAGLLSEDERTQLAVELDDYAKATGNQLLVVTVPSLQGDDIIDYTEQLFTLNKPGEKGKDKGLILLVAVQEKKVRIEVGYGLEAAVPDGKAGAIISEQIAPGFRAGDYYGGISSGIYALIKSITPEYNLSSPKYAATGKSSRHSNSSGLIWPVIIIIIFIISSISNTGNGVRRRRRRGFSEPWFWGGGGFGGGGGNSGGGFFSGGSGGGFSGGGGSFGGGGASGGW